MKFAFILSILLLFSCNQQKSNKSSGSHIETLRNSVSSENESSSTPSLFNVSKGVAHNKVTICHITGNSSSHEITVSTSAMQAHLNHGDAIGECEDSVVKICHFEENGSSSEIEISESLVQGHLEHGDNTGDCEEVVTEIVEEEVEEEVIVEEPMIVIKSNFCSLYRTLGPYSPEFNAWKYEYIPGVSSYQTFTTSERITFGFSMSDSSFFIPNQNPELNYINVAHSEKFDMKSMMNESFPSGSEVISIFYSFHSDEDIEKYGHQVFGNSFTNDTKWESKEYQKASFHKVIISILYSRLEYGDDYNCNEIYSPLVIDLNQKGINLSDPRVGMPFDINGNGSKERISCPTSSGTPFLTLPLNGEIININQLFGNHTIGPDGEKSDNGFIALAKFDLNFDGVIDQEDKVYNELRLWDEGNCNGNVDPGELSSLENKEIFKINLLYKNIFQADQYGNASKQHSYVESDRGDLNIFDVWFVGL